MLELFRSSMKSRLGGVIALLFLGLIALAFVAGDVSGSRMFGGVAGGDRVAVVGDRRISTSELSQAATNAVDQLRQENPRLTMKEFIAAGGLPNAVDQLIDRAAMTEFGAKHGITVTERLVDSEIAKIGAFKGADGKFSEAAYRALLRQRGIGEAALRQDIGDGLVARQVLVPAGFGVRMPLTAAARYAALLTERRTGAIALLPAGLFAPAGEPSAVDLAAYYNANRARYTRPERRVIRYASFDDSAVKAVPPPGEAEIAAAYAARKASFAPTERRRLTQLVLPSEAAAKAVVAELAGGKSMEAAAASKGLATAALPAVTRPALQAQANEAVAAAAFATPAGKVTGPVRGPLGWTLLRVDGAETTPGKTLEQARPELSAALLEAKRRAALSDLTARLEDEFDKGGSLGDVAKELSLELTATPPLTADGKVYLDPAKAAPPELARVVQAAFSMEREGQPQVAEIVAGKQYLVFDVARITSADTAPLAQIRDQVLADLRLQNGAAAARTAAEKVQAAVKTGTDLQSAVAALRVPTPPVRQVDMDRQQLASKGQVPPSLGLLFAMAQGTTKVLAAPGNGGWYVVTLKRITPGTIAPGNPLLAQAASELSAIAAREYADQLRTAIRAEVGVSKNQAGIDAVARQLTGGN
ncbi:MAG: SurA N-terminal domain-containing protein [Pseudomonadota bacterium]